MSDNEMSTWGTFHLVDRVAKQLLLFLLFLFELFQLIFNINKLEIKEEKEGDI